MRKIKRNRHHLTPRSRGGKTTQSNILKIDVVKHRKIHEIFHNLTLEEIIAVLQRLQKMKKRPEQTVIITVTTED